MNCWYARVELGHAALPVVELGQWSNVVGLASYLLALDEHLLDLTRPRRHYFLQLLHQVSVICCKITGLQNDETIATVYDGR